MTLQEYQDALNDIRDAFIDWKIDYPEFTRLQDELLAYYTDNKEE